MGLIILIISVVVLDQLSKFLIRMYIKGRDSLIVIDNFFSISYVENRGAAWGMFSDKPWGHIFLTVFTSFFTVYLGIVLFKLRNNTSRIFLALIVAGSLGNLIDRIVFSYVTDFITFQFGSWFFPSFNVADIAIVLGTLLLGFHLFFNEKAFDEFIWCLFRQQGAE